MNAATSTLDALAGAWWSWMAPLILPATWLAAIAWLIERALHRRAWPQFLAAAWWIVLARLVLPPSLVSPLALARLLPGGSCAVTASAAPGADASAWSAAVAATGPTDGVAVVLMVAWLAGVLAIGAWTVVRHARVRRLWIDGSFPCRDAALVALHERCARSVGLRRAPALRIHPRVATAAVVGVRRPCVILPRELALAADHRRIEHVLLHELGHVRRRDPLASLAVLVVQVVWWFHPAAWLARARLATLREIACDLGVARTLGGEAAAYRRTLLELARPMLTPDPAAALAFFRRPGQLLTRLRWLERPIPGHTRLRSLASGTLFVTLLVCCVPLAPPPLVPTPAPETAFVAPRLDEVQGCLAKRYLVMRELARQLESPVH